MAFARLHVICGNCGQRAENNKYFTFNINPEGHDITDDVPKFEPAVFLHCRNCGTLHDLSDTVADENSPKEAP